MTEMAQKMVEILGMAQKQRGLKLPEDAWKPQNQLEDNLWNGIEI